jgi:glycosyltransferase involved in cell wall biosynthesis
MNNTLHYQFTVIVPVYNEEEGIARLATALGEFIAQGAVPSCVLFVNDGSTDNSQDLIKKECEARHHFFYLCFDGNRGLSAAIKAGIDYAESQWVGYIDADLQTDPLDFNILLSYANEFPLVTGIRANRKDSHFKRIQSKIANRFRRLMTGDTATDTGCPLKVIQTEYAKRIPFFIGMHRFLPALIMLQQDGRFKEIPVHHYPRISGQSKFHLWNRLKGPFIDCFAYRWMKKRAIRYQIKSQYI